MERARTGHGHGKQGAFLTPGRKTHIAACVASGGPAPQHWGSPCGQSLSRSGLEFLPPHVTGGGTSPKAVAVHGPTTRQGWSSAKQSEGETYSPDAPQRYDTCQLITPTVVRDRNLFSSQHSGTARCTQLNQRQRWFWLNSVSTWKSTHNEPSWAAAWQCVT